MEQWKDIKDYEDYMVSNLGNIKSLKYGKVKYPKVQIDDNGYRFIKLSKKNISKKFKIGRLVAIAFIPNPDNLPTVDHLDRNSLNDNVENLRWVTQGDNNRNRYMPNHRGESIGTSFWKKEQVIEIKKLRDQGLGKRKIAKIFNCTPTQAQSAMSCWKHLESANQSN
jgi:hypothetical protein